MKKHLFEVSGEEKQRILEMHSKFLDNKTLITEQSATDVTIKTTQKAEYSPNSSDPSSFIDTFVDNLIIEITKNPEAKKMFDSKQLMISSIFISAGASNVWNGIKTGYNLENTSANYTNAGKFVPSKDTDPKEELYNKNLALAKKRGSEFIPKILEKLKSKGILVSNSYSPKVNSWVVNTGGQLDNDRNTKTYINFGQFIACTLTVGYKKDIQTFKTTMTTLTDIKKGYVITGSYFCNGSNSIDKNDPKNINKSNQDTYIPMCDAVRKKFPPTPENLNNLNKYMSSFEMKWSPDVLENPWDVPVLRWNFTWGDDGKGGFKIVKVDLNRINKVPKLTPSQIFPTTVSSVDDPTLKYIMGLNDGDTTGGGTTYKTFIQPYK